MIRVDDDSVRMPGHLVPWTPMIDDVTPALELVDGASRKARLHVQRVARLAEREAAGEKAWHLERLLDIEPVVDHRHVGLQLDLRLPVRAHAAEDAPKFAVSRSDRRGEGVQRNLSRFQAVGM